MNNKIKLYLLSFFFLGNIGILNAQDIIYSNPVPVDSLNSSAEESLPLFDSKNNTMYLVRTFHEKNTGGKKSGNEIWAFDKTEKNVFTSSTYRFDKLNNKFSNAVVGINEGGTTLYLLNNYTAEGETKPGISFSTLKDKKWARPKNIKLQGISPELKIYNLFVNQAENMMLLSMRKMTNKGDTATLNMADTSYNIYVSEKIGTVWSKPVLLNGINTSGSDEISPYMSKDNKTIYFSSDREGGRGGFDIYQSKSTDTKYSWKTPLNLDAINSSSFDAYFSLGENNTAYFSSNRKGGLADIYQTSIKKIEKDTVKSKIVDYTNDEVVSAHPFVNFAFDKYSLNESAQQYLDLVADSMKSNPKWKVRLDGHTDYIGSNSYNRTLSKNRALSARNYLIKKGIKAGRIDTRYFGERRPKTTSKTDLGRYINRRVEITFLKK